MNLKQQQKSNRNHASFPFQIIAQGARLNPGHDTTNKTFFYLKK